MSHAYPENERMSQVVSESQAIGDFLEWLQGKYTICTYHPVVYKTTEDGVDIVEDPKSQHPLHAPVRLHLNHLLAEYFDIDLKKIEVEKQQMIKDLHSR